MGRLDRNNGLGFEAPAPRPAIFLQDTVLQRLGSPAITLLLRVPLATGSHINQTEPGPAQTAPVVAAEPQTRSPGASGALRPAIPRDIGALARK